MATTPTPKSRAVLIREMADELNRDHRSVAPPPSRSNRNSPNGLLDPGFDPANEAIVSTSQIDGSEYSLPEFRVSAGPGQPEKRFVIDTSAIARVFPDWGRDSSSDSTSSSIETGRGKKEIRLASNPVRHLEEFSSDLQLHNYGNESEHSIKGADAKAKPVRISSTLAQVQSAKKAANERDMKAQAQHDLFAIEDKENRRPTSPTAKPTDNVSRPSTLGNGEPRRTLAEMHARVTDEDDESLLGEERPPTLDLTSRSTRFSRPNSRLNSVNPSASTAKSKEDLNSKKPESNKPISGRSPQKPVTSQAIPPNSLSANVTYQSFVLPDLPNLSELVSGVHGDGTPIFSRHVSHGSRFANGRQYNYHPEDDIDDPAVDGVPMPYEEKAILISLRLLQDKVVELEKEKAGREKTIDELQDEVKALKVEKEQRERRRRSDSALGLGDSGSDAGDEMGKGRHKIALEKARLEQYLKVLQDRLDAANRAVSVADLSIKNLTRERDSANARLGLAYCSSEELQHENHTLRSEIEALKKQLAQILEEHEAQKQEWFKRETSLKQKVEQQDEAIKMQLAQILEEHEAEKQEWLRREVSLKQKLERQDEAANKVRDMTRDLWDLRKLSYSVQGPHTQDLAGNNIAATEVEGKSHTQPPPGNAQQAMMNANQVNAEQKAVTVQPEIPKRKRTRTVIVEETIHSHISEPENANQTGTQNLNNIYCGDDNDGSVISDDTNTSQMSRSFLLPEELEKLRKIVEEEKAKHQAQRVEVLPERSAQDEVVHIDDKPNKPAVIKQDPLPRKSSLKASAGQTKADAGVVGNEEHTGNLSIKAGENTEQFSEGHVVVDETRHSKATSSRRRRRAGSSRGAVKPYATEDNMTSAYILPDITIRNPPVQPVVSANAQCVGNGLSQHDGRNCTICRGTTSDEIKPVSNKFEANTTNMKNVIKIPKPVPVSERMPEPIPYEDEPTIRPSQPPAIALAVVMKALEDELAHLKLEAAKYQAAYNDHDASLGKHKRKRLCKKLGALLKAVDIKADQIYALYDVLEGQKKDGHIMSEQQIEVTLHSIGLDLAELSTKTEKKTQSKNQEPRVVRNAFDDLSGSSDEEELPWEGFEDTAPVSRTGPVGRSRRSSLGG